jgi:hypothetical protein
MLNDVVLLENLIEDVQRTSTVDHVVLGDDLEPADYRLLAEDVIVMRNAETDPHSEIFVAVKAIGCHGKR